MGNWVRVKDGFVLQSETLPVVAPQPEIKKNFEPIINNEVEVSEEVETQSEATEFIPTKKIKKQKKK